MEIALIDFILGGKKALISSFIASKFVQNASSLSLVVFLFVFFLQNKDTGQMLFKFLASLRFCFYLDGVFYHATAVKHNECL